MAESMLGLKRSHRCAEVVNAPLESEVTVMGLQDVTEMRT